MQSSCRVLTPRQILSHGNLFENAKLTIQAVLLRSFEDTLKTMQSFRAAAFPVSLQKSADPDLVDFGSEYIEPMTGLQLIYQYRTCYGNTRSLFLELQTPMQTVAYEHHAFPSLTHFWKVL